METLAVEVRVRGEWALDLVVFAAGCGPLARMVPVRWWAAVANWAVRRARVEQKVPGGEWQRVRMKYPQVTVE